MMCRKRNISLIALLVLLLLPAGAWGEKGTVFTLWPLLDYRRSPVADYTSIHFLGPLVKYERKGTEREFGLRPLYFRAWDGEEGAGTSDLLYPVGSRQWSEGSSSYQGLHLLQSDSDQGETGSGSEFMLFPLVFSGKTERGRYFALFPLGGNIYEKFGRDEINFALFPLYGRTRKQGTTVTNVLWPVFSRTRGDKETGVKFWPLFGASRKEGVYRKRFYLWPVFFRDDLRLNTANPEHRRAAFPLYVSRESPQFSSRTYLWPFFSHVRNRQKNYEEWNFPWPLLRVTRGSGRQGERLLPLYADERNGGYRKRWFLWPVYKIEELHTEMIDRRRDRVLFFLFSRLHEERKLEGKRKKRVALWPLFTYEEENGVTRFSTLSLLEPFFPDNAGIQRNWAPLWHVYQVKSDRRGNEISSLLWNLYWKERRGPDLAVELFPLFFYRHEGAEEGFPIG